MSGRSVSGHRMVRQAENRADRQEIEVRPGPAVPCHRWDDDARTFVPAIEATTLRLTNLGVPSAAFFVCRDPKAEASMGVVPLFVVCELESGIALPIKTRTDDRTRTVEMAKAFLLSVRPEQRPEAIKALQNLGKSRRRR